MKLTALAILAGLLLFGCLDQIISSSSWKSYNATPVAYTPTPVATLPASTLVPTISSTATPTPTAVPVETAAPTISTATPSATAQATPAATPTATSIPSPTPAPTVQVFQTKIVMKQFSFEPSEVRVKQGTKVELEVSVPAGDVTHGIAIPDFSVNEVVSSGESKLVKFTADKPPGTYNFFCSVFCGSGHGRMSGKIIVE